MSVAAVVFRQAAGSSIQRDQKKSINKTRHHQRARHTDRQNRQAIESALCAIVYYTYPTSHHAAPSSLLSPSVYIIYAYRQ